MIPSLNVLNSPLRFQHSNLPVSLAGAAREGTERGDIRSWRASEIPRGFLWGNLLRCCPPNPTARCPTRARPSEKHLRQPGGGFFQLLKPQDRKSAGIQQVRQAKASTDREVLSAGSSASSSSLKAPLRRKIIFLLQPL